MSDKAVTRRRLAAAAVVGVTCSVAGGASPGSAGGLPKAVAEAQSLKRGWISPVVGFDAFHVQGLLVTKNRFYFTSVNAKKGEGWLFKLDRGGLRQLGRRNVAIDQDIHPGGIDFDGRAIWVPVAAYRKHSHAHILSVDPETLEVRRRFEVNDHIGAIARHGELVIGANWGAEDFYFWTVDGKLLAKKKSPTGVAYQDCKGVDGYLACLGGGYLDWIDVERWQLVKRFPVARSLTGSSLSREGLGLLGSVVFFLPDDGLKARIYAYRFSCRPADAEDR